MKKAILFLCVLFSCLRAEEPIHLIWLGVDPKRLWEVDWIHEILQDVKAPIEDIVDMEGKVFVDRSILVCSSLLPWEHYASYLDEWNARGLKYGIIQLGDEMYESPAEELYPSLSFVIRNYWHKRYADQKNVLCVPLGYKTGFWNKFHGAIKTATQRKYNWSFAGQFRKSTRYAMIISMWRIRNGYIHETPWFGSPNSLSATEYRDLLLETVFLPCPRGFWNLDSFRISEALEAGCIPIVEKTPLDYFEKFYGPYPFLSVNGWEEAPKLIEELLADPARLEALQLSCFNWWHDYKLKVRKQVADLVESKLMQE